MFSRVKDPGSALTHFIALLGALAASVPLLLKAASEPERCSAMAQAQSLAEETAMDLTISDTDMVSPTFR